jgi:hypothetical protein
MEAGEGLDRPGLTGRGVLDGLRLIEHHQRPLHLLQPALPSDHAVGSDDKLQPFQARRAALRGKPFRGMDHPDPQTGGEAGALGLPVPDERGGDHQERWAAPAAGSSLALRFALEVEEEGQNLHGLPQTHVVRQAASQAELVEEPEPLHPLPLVGTERGSQRAGGEERALSGGAPQLFEHPSKPRAAIDGQPS